MCVCVCVLGVGGGWQDDWGRRGTLNMCSQAEHTARDRVQWAILYRHHFLAVYIAAPERNSLCSSPPPPPPTPPLSFLCMCVKTYFLVCGWGTTRRRANVFQVIVVLVVVVSK